MNRHRREFLFLLCVIEFNASCAASQGEPGWQGTYPVARNNVCRHSATFLIFADISFNALGFSHTAIFCSILLKVYLRSGCWQKHRWARISTFRRQVGQSFHQLRMRSLSLPFQHFLFVVFFVQQLLNIGKVLCSQYKAFLAKNYLDANWDLS